MLINGISYVPDLVAALLDALDDSRVRHRIAALAGDVVDGLLVLNHVGGVVLLDNLVLLEHLTADVESNRKFHVLNKSYPYAVYSALEPNQGNIQTGLQ